MPFEGALFDFCAVSQTRGREDHTEDVYTEDIENNLILPFIQRLFNVYQVHCMVRLGIIVTLFHGGGMRYVVKIRFTVKVLCEKKLTVVLGLLCRYYVRFSICT